TLSKAHVLVCKRILQLSPNAQNPKQISYSHSATTAPPRDTIIPGSAAFPLTLTLSLGEREQRRALLENSIEVGLANRLTTILLLPEPYRFSWNSRSPSPQPSPPRRGRRFSSAGEYSLFNDFPNTAHCWFPLLGERVRVRASLTSDGIVRACGEGEHFIALNSCDGGLVCRI